MKLISISDLKPFDVFLTKKSKLLVFGWHETDNTIIAFRYSDKYCTEVIKDTEQVYLMENL